MKIDLAVKEREFVLWELVDDDVVKVLGAGTDLNGQGGTTTAFGDCCRDQAAQVSEVYFDVEGEWLHRIIVIILYGV